MFRNKTNGKNADNLDNFTTKHEICTKFHRKYDNNTNLKSENNKHTKCYADKTEGEGRVILNRCPCKIV